MIVLQYTVHVIQDISDLVINVYKNNSKEFNYI
jgi:hypothetical protein